MKKQLFIATGVCLLILIAAFAFSQQWTQQAIVNVPNEFVVGTTVLPAGTYSVKTSSGTNNVILTNRETGASAVAMYVDIYNKPDMNNEESNLVFVRDENGRQVLHQVWIVGDSHGHDLLHEKGLPEPQ